MKTSLPERSEFMAEQLADITHEIRQLMGEDLAMLILFGSYARGDWVNDRFEEDGVIYTYESDFDLLIASEKHAHGTMNGESRLRGAITRCLRRTGLDRPSVSVVAEHIEYLNKELRRGQYFFADIVKEGVLLYNNGRHTLAEPGPIDPAENRHYAQEDYEHWFKSASSFLKMYEAAMAIDDNNIAAFLLHQATERFFTAVVLTFTRYKPRTHDLEILDRQVSNLHVDFFTVFPRLTAEQKHRFELLKNAYIDARYKRTYVITKEELEYLAGRVRKLQELTKRICEEKIAAM